jgi:hypothetical protein
MERTVKIDDYVIYQKFNLGKKLTTVIIKKDDKVLFNEDIKKPPFAIDYAAILDELEKNM